MLLQGATSQLAEQIKSRPSVDLQLPLPYLNGSAGHASAHSAAASPLRPATSGAMTFAGEPAALMASHLLCNAMGAMCRSSSQKDCLESGALEMLTPLLPPHQNCVGWY